MQMLSLILRVEVLQEDLQVLLPLQARHLITKEQTQCNNSLGNQLIGKPALDNLPFAGFALKTTSCSL